VLFGVPITNNFGMSGGLLGGTAGCNYQFKNIVFSVENDLSWTSNTGSGSDIPPFIAGTTSSTNEKWLDSLRGRVGFACDRLFLTDPAAPLLRMLRRVSVHRLGSAYRNQRLEPAGLLAAGSSGPLGLAL
jgi:hypothetical protein